MFQNSLTAWSAVLKGRLCLTRKPEKSSSVVTTFWSKFAVVDLASKLVTFFVVVLHPYSLSKHRLSFEVSLCLLISFSPCATLKLLPHTVHKANLHLCAISDWTWIYYTTNRWIPHNIFFFHGANSELSAIFFFAYVLTFSTLTILLGNIRKIRLKRKQNSKSSRTTF